jgi:uncharacterized integral membrane protein
MLAVQNTLGFKIGSIRGTAEGPLGIAALLLIAAMIAGFAIYQTRKPPE